MKPRVVVIGGGISGLTIAYELLRRAERVPPGIDVACLETSGRAGGNIRTEHDHEFICESGPTGFLDNSPATLTLARNLGLEERIQPAGPQAQDRYIYARQRLRKVPMGPMSFLSSGLLSPWGRLRLLAEPVIPGRSRPDESIHDFVSRRIGRESATVLVDAMVSGIYAGNTRELSLRACFPKMHEMESKHGGLFRAMLARRRDAGESDGGGPAGPAGRLTSFRNGLCELTDALVEALGERLELNTSVRGVSDLGARGFRVHLSEGAPIECDAVVIACPAWHAARMVETMDAQLAGPMGEIVGAPLVVVHLGYRRAALGDQPEGFGFLVPRGQGPRILGALWISNIFEGRAPDGRMLMTVMIGGAHDPALLDLDDEAITKIVRRDLLTTMNITPAPYFVRTVRWPRGIPQYTLGHPERVQQIEQGLERHPGLWVAGNSYRGVSINACIDEAPGVAEQVAAFLARSANPAAREA